ncbi:hypothetical protein [Amphibacillus cookii]|uniref:exo-rhamnogalacturonan lyase family protein n=1 Tax=Amphibacillus cookii TaxID=767787 RepID=UPI00195E452B|nr:hypothetical protein [Amphibacillus cookii]MBM7541566.1 hypothetical protein [Amphibacillus cookii]
MKLNWLESAPKVKAGVTFGLPWKKGERKTISDVALNDYQLQSWPTAYWPDGSLKWTAHATVINQDASEHMILSDQSDSQQDHQGIAIKDQNDQIIIDTGNFIYYLNKNGSSIIDKVIDVNDQMIANQGKVVAVMQSIYEDGDCRSIIEQERLGQISRVEVEHEGDIQVTVRVTGTFGENDKLKFVIRLIFYYQLERIKILHTFLYNGDPEQDFVKGIGLQLSTELVGPVYNRHVRVATDSGIYNEPAQLLTSRRYRQSSFYQKQIQGEMVNMSTVNDVRVQAEQHAVWQDFKLTQTSYQHSQYQKRTDQTNAWLKIPTIHNTKGLLYAGGEQGGVAMALKDFNQKYPSQLAVNGLATHQTKLSVWFWSPDQEPMDLRHYSSATHVQSAYEGFEENRATPVGIANTSEAYLTFFSTVPSDQDLFNLAEYSQSPYLLVADPVYYYQTGATGTWPLIDKTTHAKRFLEDQLTKLIQFYKSEVNQRNWYGFWDYGDIMHTYDSARHQWFYDVGGYAWQNTELVPNLWLWYSFFRTGDADIFRMIEAMTRHNSEVDRYHFGPYKGLGSRHNVSHWGCGCKEVRISMACLYKYYYYLTADQRMAELLDEVKDADQALATLDPMREFYHRDDHLTHARIGPDWTAFCSNWLSRWERKKDQQYLEKINMGLNTIKQTSHRLLSGPTFKYDPTTSTLIYQSTGNEGGYHMVIAFGAPQVWIELADLLEDDVFKDMIAEFGMVYAMPEQEKQAFSDGMLSNQHFHWPMFASGLIGYAAYRKQDSDLSRQAWTLLLDQERSGVSLPVEETIFKGWQTVNEIDWITTNVVSQWSLNVLICLQYIAGDLQVNFDSIVIKK